MQRRSFAAGLVLGFAGCALPRPGARLTPGLRAFDFATDTLAAPPADPSAPGNREPLADPALRGWADAHAVRQFFLHARFDPAALPPTNERRIALVREVLQRSPAEPSPDERRVVIPGYENLREFSRLQGHVLRAETWLACGCEHRAPLLAKAFGRSDGQQVAAKLDEAAAALRPALVRLHRHRQLRYDRALLVFAAREADGMVRFAAYDPGRPGRPVELAFDRARGEFTLPGEVSPDGAALGVTLE